MKTSPYDNPATFDNAPVYTPELKSEKIELKLLLEAIFYKYGYDFRNYQKGTIKRRVLHRLGISGLKNISEMQHKLLYDEAFFETLLLDFSVNVTHMFRDPSFFKTIRKEVVPILKKQPHIKIWHAGCSTGEEIYSMAILLKEEGIYEKTRVFATDFNQKVLEKAKEGIYSIEALKDSTRNYKKSGGIESFADYYNAKYDRVLMDRSLTKNVIFADHNLATDSSFGEMHLIMCRNVLIYFNKELQDRIFTLFLDSLIDNGFLCLGSKETVRISDCSYAFGDFVAKEKIYRKKTVIGDQ